MMLEVVVSGYLDSLLAFTGEDIINLLLTLYLATHMHSMMTGCPVATVRILARRGSFYLFVISIFTLISKVKHHASVA